MRAVVPLGLDTTILTQMKRKSLNDQWKKDTLINDSMNSWPKYFIDQSYLNRQYGTILVLFLFETCYPATHFQQGYTSLYTHMSFEGINKILLSIEVEHGFAATGKF